jgi:hypothetical protein
MPQSGWEKSMLPIQAFASGLFAATAVLAASGLPAQARTRDEVMSSAYRCAEIGDAHIWLDCYYGAAQPVRAALGLQPASAAQVALALSPPAGPAPQATATRDMVLSGASRCGQLDDDRQWLNCYYAAAQPMRAFLKIPPAPQSLRAGNQNGQNPVPDPSAAADGFGFTSSRVNSVSGRMTSYSFDQKGIFTVALSNGEVWRQLSGDTSFAHWKGPPEKYIVRISRGLLGSFNLEVRNNTGMFKVHRLR